MKKEKRFLSLEYFFRFFPFALWMSLIFLFSAHKNISLLPLAEKFFDPRDPCFGLKLHLLDLAVKKTAHFLEFFILTVFTFRAVDNPAKPAGHSYRISFIIALIFAVTDELHQVYTPTRVPGARDVAVDCAGILTALAFIRIRQEFRKNKIQPPGVKEICMEIYSPEQKAQFLLNNTLTAEEYAWARDEVEKLGLNPDNIPHDKQDNT
jgi:VanZ family protein